ncbi:MAG: peptide ABC transporter substrate-binding protein [Opitutus sp.]|nr:peptide ABC transporter substrate-binding protein [Opitutus sp.]
MRPLLPLCLWRGAARPRLRPARRITRTQSSSAPTALRALACLSIGILAALLLASCGKRDTATGAGSSARGTTDGLLHVSVGSEPTDLDPHVVTSLSEARILPTLFEALVNFDPDTLAPTPGLAERWDVSDDGLTYTFHLRETQWSNGEPLVAQDVIDSWQRVLTPSLAADYAYFFYVIRGAEDFHKGRAKNFSGVGLVAPDSRTLVVTLTHPTPYFLQILLNSPWRPVNVRAIARVGEAFQRGTRWTRPENIVTSGPFRLREWTPHQHIRVEKSPTYWDAANVQLPGLAFYPTDSVDAEERAFRAGQLHVTYSVSLSKLTTYRRDQAASLRIDDYVNTFLFRFNTRKAPLDNPALRRALSLAIDREIITEKILKGGQKPAASFTPPNIPGYTPPMRPVRDLAAARRLLAEAGYADGKGLPPLEILYNNSEINRIVAEAIQEMWRRDLGITATLVNQEYKVVFANRRTGSYQILLGDWVADYLDPTTFLDLWRSDSGNNHTGWSSADYDALMNRAKATVDPAQRAALLQQAETLMLDAAPIAPIYFNTHVYLLSPSVRGWKPSPMDHIDYRHVSLAP